MSGGDNLTFWLKMFLAFWVGMALGVAAMGWATGKVYTEQAIALRAVIATVVAAVLATFRMLGRKT